MAEMVGMAETLCSFAMLRGATWVPCVAANTFGLRRDGTAKGRIVTGRGGRTV